MSFLVFLMVVACVLMMGFYSGSKVAYATANRLNIELRKKQGYPSGIILSRLFDQPSRFLGIIVVGYNFFLVLFILLVSNFWSTLMNTSLISNWIASDGRMLIRLLLEILLSVATLLLLGDLIPKALFRVHADSLLLLGGRSGLLDVSEKIYWPVAQAFFQLSVWILDIFFNVRIDRKKDPIQRSDIEQLLREGAPAENTQDLDTHLLEAALELPKVRVRECLVPRNEVEAIDVRTPVAEVRSKMIRTKLSKLVVFENNIDHIIGYIHQLDLFKNPDSVRDILLSIPAVPETMGANDLITRFTKERKSIAWVVDEFGGTAGIVTMEDLLEEIFGEIRDEYDEEEFEERALSPQEFIFSGRLELDYLRDKYGLEFPEEESETLSGYIIHQHQTIPRLKERITLRDYEFEILNVSDTRIERVKLKRLS